jgi:hypothetical protein
MLVTIDALPSNFSCLLVVLLPMVLQLPLLFSHKFVLVVVLLFLLPVVVVLLFLLPVVVVLLFLLPVVLLFLLPVAVVLLFLLQIILMSFLPASCKTRRTATR